MGISFSNLPRQLVKAPKGTDLANAALAQKPAYVADERLLCRMVNAITDLAILNSDVIHIHTSYYAHVKEFSIRINDAKTDYYSRAGAFFEKGIYLDNSLAYEQLRDLEDKLIELIADAKDKAMGAV